MAFQSKLGALRFFDPACGCGNFLVISYRELRELELDILKELNPLGQRTLLNVAELSKIDVNQFYGIEIGEFPARIAEVALWMMDHIMNNKLSVEFAEPYLRIPLTVSPHIHNHDALEMDWETVVSARECSYVFGNPPFAGSKLQSPKQRDQVRRIANLGGSGGTLDYVAAWFLKAGAYVQKGSAPIGFVATNSITQGEQVAQLWPLLFARYGLEIAFAHRTFAWGSDARGKAHVHVIIIGLTRRDQEAPIKRLFSYEDINGDPVESNHKVLSPYLFDAEKLRDRHLVVKETNRPITDAPRMITGCQPIDDGQYIFSDEEAEEFLSTEPAARKFLRPYASGDDFIYGEHRWILALQDATPAELNAMPRVRERMHAVREFRRVSTRPATRAIADFPATFNVEAIPTSPFLAIPEVSSERRDYIPIAWLEPPLVPSNKIRFIADADTWIFGILTSRMHMAWTRYIGGRLKSDFQYSLGINYNPFPWPVASQTQRAKVRELAQGVLDARAKFADATLAELYEVDAMKAELRKAHRALDVAVDKLYRAAGFASDRDRVEHLFSLYENLSAPLTAAQVAARRPAIDG